MGYSFLWEPPRDGADSGCDFNVFQMQYVRLVMIEAGAIAGDGFASPPSPRDGLDVTADTLPASKFMSNGGWHITPEQAAFIAARLRQAVRLDVVPELLMFLDDGPSTSDLRGWVEEFATFNEHAAQRDGYYVS